MEQGFLNHAEEVPGLTNQPLVVHVHPQQDSSRRSEKGDAEGAATIPCSLEMALFVTQPMSIFIQYMQ